MPNPPRSFVLVDSRTLDGDCFEVAGKAAAQIESLLKLTQACVEPARILARNAQLERELMRGDDPDAFGWAESTEGKKWSELETALAAAVRQAGLLGQVAAFNPKGGLDE